MAQNISLKQIERKAWKSSFQDGLLDILFGFMLLVLGIPDLFPDIFTSEMRQNAAYVVFAVLGLLIMWAGKRFISLPRMGRAKFGPTRKARQTRVAVIYAISVIAGVIVFLMAMLAASSSPSPWIQRLGARGFIALASGAWMLFILGLASYFTDFTRGYVIAVFYALGFAGTVLLSNPRVMLLAGSPIILMGAVVFIRFLRTYPKPEAEPMSEAAFDVSP